MTVGCFADIARRGRANGTVAALAWIDVGHELFAPPS